MKIRKYLLILILFVMLANITCINAMDNDTSAAESITQNFTNINANDQAEITLQENHENLLQSEENDQLSATGPSPPDNNFWNNDNGKIYHTQLTLTVNDTTTFNTTKNATMHLHLDWDLYMNQDHYNTCQIRIYENNTIIHTFNISCQSDVAYEHNAHQTLDMTFPYTIKDRTELKAVLLEIESNTLSFEEIKKISITNLSCNTTIINDSIIVNGNCLSNENWTNQLKYLKKAIDEAPANSIILLNNIEILNDEDITITIDKNLTIIGNNATINGLEHGTIFAISQQSNAAFINLTFINTATNYIIHNNGKLKIINTIFNNNVARTITNDGDLTLENCIIENTSKKYYAQSLNNIITTSENGLIYNTKNLIIKNSTFDNIDLHPITIIGKKLDWTGIIVNRDQTQITGCRFTNINCMTIHNNGILEMNKTLMENITSTSITSHTVQYINQLNSTVKYFSYTKASSSIEGGAIYNNNQATITDTTFQKITGTNGAIYNNKNLNIINTTFQSINNGAIYNNKNLNIINTTFQSINNGAIYNYGNQLTIENSLFISASLNNKKYCRINNSTITKSGISNDGEMIINNTIISNYNGLVVSNSGTMTITHSQILNNNGNGNVILNNENGKFLLEKSIIKENAIKQQSANGWLTYLGVVKNNGKMEITGCIFDNNKASDWDPFFGVMQSGSINIYNVGTLTVMYNYLINTQYYTLDEFHGSTSTVPIMFLLNAGGTSNVNYNFLCLDPNRIIKNTPVNYYFIPAFEDDYYPVKLNENINITLTLGLTNMTDKIDFNDWDKLLTPGLNATITTLDENGEYINISTFLKDKYVFNFNYTKSKGEYLIYANIMNYNNTGVVEVGKEFACMTVTCNNITYKDGSKITFHIKVTGNLTNQPTGNVTFTYNNKKVTLNLTDGECNYTIDEMLDPANYTMRIDYNGDEEYFRIIKQYCPFTVHKIPTNITISAPEIKIGQRGEVTIKTGVNDAKLYGYLYYTTDRLHEANADTKGTRTIYLNNCPVGVYNLTVVFKEDDYYLGGTASTLFIVSKYTTNLTVEGIDIKAGENETLNITINPGDVRGNAVLKINNETQSIFINDTATPITLTDLEEGTYHVTVYYPGDAKYAQSTATTTFSVSRITSHLTVDLTQNINLTGNIKILTNPLNCTGEVAIYVNNDMTILNLINGSIKTQIKLKRGSNYIYVHYNGDRYYSISSWNTSFSIEGIPVLSLETQKLETDKTGYVRVNLTDTNNIPYEYTDITVVFANTTTVLKTDENGTVYYPVKAGAGTYNITASYENASITKTLTVKTQSILNVEIASVNEADDLMVYATLTDSNGNKLTGDIMLEINGNYYKKIIITDGTGSRNLGQFKQATYTYTAAYYGNDMLWSTNLTGSFQVKKDSYKITQNKDIIQYYGATKTYNIRLTNNNQPVKNEIVTIKINKNTVKVKTDNNGYATLKLSLKAGKYTIIATYKNVKVSNKITVKPTLITKDKKIKKGKTLTYTAKLLNKNGKALKGKKITFKIKGKKYTAKTNKKGIAKIKVKNLKKGKHKITIAYGKQENKNTITVK